mmetsp:Transcript_19911/g.3251  ORF Transcript_19911/g.3251 Transcript_19911/m.3251 type:complete len:80 (+) Transcript_19911:246-485(+)
MQGTFYGSVPVFIVIVMMFYWKGNEEYSNIFIAWSNMDPPTEDMFVGNNRGRAGLILFIVGGLLLLHGGKLLIPLPNDS